MTERTRVILVRHGETEWNVQGRLQGHLDSDLTPRGVAQAKSLAARLAGMRLDALYTSDLGRAYKTAQRIAESTGRPIRPEPRLRERALGVFEGLNEAEISERYPMEWQQFRSRDPDFRVPEGETSRERVNRSKEVLEELGERHRGERILIVTHGGILDGIFRFVIGLPLETPRQFKLWNAGINLISRAAGPHAEATTSDTGALRSGGPAGAAGDGWMVELWGDTGNLLEQAVLDDA